MYALEGNTVWIAVVSGTAQLFPVITISTKFHKVLFRLLALVMTNAILNRVLYHTHVVCITG